MLPRQARPGLSIQEQAMLTDYATGARYPGWGEIPLARRAVTTTRRARKELRSLLPKNALRSKGT